MGCGIEAEKEKQPHVLMMPWPAQGHINPMMHLAKTLVAKGIRVTFVNTEVSQGLMEKAQEKAGIPMPNNDTNLGLLQLVSVYDGLTPEDIYACDVPKQVVGFHAHVQPRLLDLLHRRQGPPITCVVADILVEIMRSVADALGVPHVGFWPQSAASFAIHLYFAENHATIREMLDKHGRTNEARFIDFIPGCPAIKYKEVSNFIQPCDPSDPIFSNIIQMFTNIHDKHSYLILNTVSTLELESFHYIRKSNILTIGPTLPLQYVQNGVGTKNCNKLGTSMWTEDDKCIGWLDKQKPRSVLYVSFGSITQLSSKQIFELARGLEETGCPILMVARPSMFYGENAVFPDSFAKKLLDGHTIISVEWAPQLEVLAHPSIGGFLTHAGWNSTLESISKGVPMLCWPYFADQMLDARFIVDVWKVGLEFEIDTIDNLVSHKQIGKKIKHLMDPISSKDLRDKAHELSGLVKSGYHGESKANLDLVVDFLFK